MNFRDPPRLSVIPGPLTIAITRALISRNRYPCIWPPELALPPPIR